MSNAKRVLIIVENLPVPFDRRVWSEATTLQKAGYQVCVICPKGPHAQESYELLEGVHIYRHPLPVEARGMMAYPLEYATALMFEFYLTCKIFFTRGFDIIHACNPPDTIFIIAAFFRLFNKQFIFDHHDINPELYIAKFKRKDFFHRVLLRLEKWTFKCADISIATNESYKKIAIERGKMSPEKVFIVRSGPKIERLKIQPTQQKLKKGRQYLVGYVGVIGQQEGIDLLLESVDYIVHNLHRIDIHFGIVGGGPALDDMKRLAHKLNIDDYITFTGRVPDQDLLDMLNTADICVNPDRVNEMNDKSTMNKIMEYMALKKPIVQFDLTEGKVSAGAASLYAKANDIVDFAEKILELLADPKRSQQMGEIGFERIHKQLAWQYEAPKLLAAYDALALLKPRNFLSNPLWLWHRLQSMQAGEIKHRLYENSKRYFSKCFTPKPPDITAGALPRIPIDIPFAIDKELQNGWMDLSNLSQQGKYRLLSTDWPQATGAEKWHLDPITQKFWPNEAYCFDISYRHERELGDIKYVWELNRLQFLQPIAALAAQNKDAQLAQFCAAEIESWIDANPPYKGVNWASTIELSLRIVSMLTVIGLIGEAAFSPAQNKKIRQSLYAHAYWIERYPSKFSSANNHLIAEAAALFVLGALTPDLPNTQHFEAVGRQTIIEQASKQIHPDGVGAEQSPTYTAFTLEWLLLCCKVADEIQKPLPNVVTERMKHAAKHLRFLTDDGNHQPRIGDDDEGRVFYGQESDYTSSILASLSAYFDDPNIAPPIIRPHLRDFIFGVAKVNHQAMNGLRSYKGGGYTILRETINQHQLMLVLDHGPLGYLSIAAHGHADALAIWLHIDDRPIFIDAGTYLYHSGGQYRDYFRGTMAHNTLTINQKNQSIITGPFNWSHRARSKLNHAIYNAGQWSIDAQHDGYQKAFGVIHRRKISKDVNSKIV
ncbi:MAG: heparinase II/III family protein, partial [Alphaproteobacteria bacterium]|nr:heparinase II/III family protein [Alphaproteobacteria bacterium]